MKTRIDNFLLGLLWLLACTLGASFWFTTRFGFSLFTIQHWQYLGQLQASRTPINAWFYISLVIFAVIMIGGLYLIVRPRFRKIKLACDLPPPTVEQLKPIEKPLTAPEPEKTVTTTQTVQEPVTKPVSSTARPPRLVLPTITNPVARPATPTAATVPTLAPENLPVIAPQNNDGFAEIENIFKSAGYVIKKPPRLNGLRPALYAIGSDEVVWIGSVGVEPSRLAKSVEKLREIFVETLEDIEIHINAFVIDPKPDNAEVDSPISILSFGTVGELATYITTRPNPPLASDDTENFDAYSEYIDTVTGYFNKV
ncbi:hypothetical protein LJC18_04185 [Lachnospiraceae bacterium OttesenSCG-928-E19]|nr:hypothetical protein [Lachnospiraceae bacterium OttesenSCG-928-E19]